MEPRCLSEAIVRLEVVNLAETNLTEQQMEQILEKIATTEEFPLNNLDLSCNPVVYSISPLLISRAASRLEIFRLADGTGWQDVEFCYESSSSSPELLDCLLRSAGESQNTRCLDLSFCRLETVSPQSLSQAASATLGTLDLQSCHLTKQQINNLLQAIELSECPSVRNLNLQSNNLSSVSYKSLSGAVCRLEEVNLGTRLGFISRRNKNIFF